MPGPYLNLSGFPGTPQLAARKGKQGVALQVLLVT